jgi:DNA (cytosine-5)-methyltransferase 1
VTDAARLSTGGSIAGDVGRNDMDLSTGELREMSLFSGYGGYSLGLQLAGIRTRTVCYVENDPYAQQVLQQRFGDGLHEAPIWDDIKTFDPSPWRGHVDIVTAGFPCQPHSIAGKRDIEDNRNLWPETLKCIRLVRPTYAALENVPGILLGNGERQPYSIQILGELAALGFSDIRWGVYTAHEAGAPHLRKRWFVLAHS